MCLWNKITARCVNLPTASSLVIDDIFMLCYVSLLRVSIWFLERSGFHVVFFSLLFWVMWVLFNRQMKWQERENMSMSLFTMTWNKHFIRSIVLQRGTSSKCVWFNFLIRLSPCAIKTKWNLMVLWFIACIKSSSKKKERRSEFRKRDVRTWHQQRAT